MFKRKKLHKFFF